MRICLHFLNGFLTEKFIFCALICASHYTENYWEEESKLFFEILCCFVIHIFWKSLCNLQIFYRSVFRYKALRPFVLFVWISVHSIRIFFLLGKKVDLVVIFNKGRKESFAVSLQNRRSCVCIKHLTLVLPRNLVATNFTFSCST